MWSLRTLPVFYASFSRFSAKTRASFGNEVMMQLNHKKHKQGQPGTYRMVWLAFWLLGFSAWIGMLYVDHYHANPVLVSFCHILITSHRERRQQQAIKYWYLNPSAGKSPVWTYTRVEHQETSTLRLSWDPWVVPGSSFPALLPPLSMPWDPFYPGDQEA